MILGIDTAGPANHVTLVTDEAVLASFSLRQPATASRPLLRLIDAVCTQAGCAMADVTALAVNIGPGAFTGLRVGLATAQGLALAYAKPLVGCSAFEALVSLVPYWSGLLCPVLEAYRGEVYAAFYRRDGEIVQEIVPGVVLTPAALCADIKEPTLFLGSGVSAYGADLVAMLGEQAICINIVEAETGLAVPVARRGQARLQTVGPAALPVPQPLYIRPADARLPRVAASAARITP
jgi:tRNA threonylcarbamoyladenosine biosynthesis protein TsaB